MRILLNLTPVYRGGGQQNALNLWRSVARYGSGDEWLCVGREGMGYEEHTTADWQSLETVRFGGLWGRLRTDNRLLPGLAQDFGADVILTPMGAGPAFPDRPSVMGWHDSTVAYPESPFWSRVGWKQRTWRRYRERYARNAARRAARVCVQTSVMADRLSARWRVGRDHFVVVPNGPSAFFEGWVPPSAARPVAIPARVLVIGDPKPTKNFEIIPAVGAALEKAGASDVEFVMTFSDDTAPYLGPFRAAIRRIGERVPIRRVGQVAHRDLAELYAGADVVFLPSLLESFSATYVEAMQFGVPLVTSGLDFAREICGDAAEYVDPLDAEDCAHGLLRVLGDQVRQAKLREEGFHRVKAFPSWERRFGLYRQACAEAVGEWAGGSGYDAASGRDPIAGDALAAGDPRPVGGEDPMVGPVDDTDSQVGAARG